MDLTKIIRDLGWDPADPSIMVKTSEFVDAQEETPLPLSETNPPLVLFKEANSTNQTLRIHEEAIIASTPSKDEPEEMDDEMGRAKDSKPVNLFRPRSGHSVGPGRGGGGVIREQANESENKTKQPTAQEQEPMHLELDKPVNVEIISTKDGRVVEQKNDTVGPQEVKDFDAGGIKIEVEVVNK